MPAGPLGKATMSRRILKLGSHCGLYALLCACLGCSLQTATHHTPGPVPVAATTPSDTGQERAATPSAMRDAGPQPAEAGPGAEPTLAWDRMRDEFRLPEQHHPRLDAHIDWFQRNPAYLDRVFDRADPFLAWILDRLEEHDMPAEIALLPVVESGFQPFAYSHGRAAGLWQFIPGTGDRFGLKQNWWYDGRRDVVDSTQAAIEYLSYLRDYFDGDWLLALAAYNSGEGTVKRAVERNRAQGRPTDFWHLELPRETREYVPKLLALRDIVADPDRYAIELPELDAAPQITLVDTAGQIDLAVAADLADMEITDLYRLNPGFNRWATDPNGPHRLVIPVEAAENFAANLAGLSDEQRVTWKRHRIERGETLVQIAQRYHTTVALLQKTNALKDHGIRVGDHLLIPVAQRELTAYALSAPQRERSRVETRVRQGAHTYTVRSGDTLWQIARRHQLSVAQLARMNGMAPRDPLRPGRTLIVGTAATTTTASAHPVAPRQKVHYTVRQGDSLARISQRFRVSVADLRSWNNLTTKAYLQPGQRLTLYVDITRQAGNS